jgi:hypothetical protein
MKFLPKSGRDFGKILKARLWLAPFFGAGGRFIG